MGWTPEEVTNQGDLEDTDTGHRDDRGHELHRLWREAKASSLTYISIPKS